MARRTRGQGRFSNRQKTWFWILMTTAIVVALLYWEQIALLYVLATLSMTLLLLIVAISDLSGAQTAGGVVIPSTQTPSPELAATIAPTVPQSTFGGRTRKKRR